MSTTPVRTLIAGAAALMLAAYVEFIHYAERIHLALATTDAHGGESHT